MNRLQRASAGGPTEACTRQEVFMVKEGTLHILWVNGPAHHEVPSYHLGFADYESGIMKMKTIIGDDDLKTFLGEELDISPEVIDAALEDLKRDSSANVFDVELSDGTLAKLGLL
jgi:hypothetical protein